MKVRLEPWNVREGVRIAATFGSPKDPLWRESITNALSDLLELVRAGGASGPRISPELSSAELDILELSDKSVLTTWSVARFDPRYLAVIRNAFRSLDREVIEMQHLVFAWDGSPGPELPSKGELPSGHAPPAFELAADFSTVDLVDVGVHHRGTEAQAEELVRRLGSWFSVVSLGGFDSDEERVVETPIALDDAPTLLPGLVHFPLAEVRCDDAAFDSLINVVQRFHIDTAPVVLLTIE